MPEWIKRLLIAAYMIGVIAIALILASERKKEPEPVVYPDNFTTQELSTPTPSPTATPTPTPKPNRATLYHKYILRGCYLDEIPLLTVDLKLTSLGKYYVTAYCPYECGYNGSNYPRGWTTASDIICHRANYSNRYTEPTTCAVDPRLHKIGSSGDLFYLPYFDRVFIAEDTGSAVKNKHLDLFYIEYSDVVSFPTGYYDTYSVELVYSLEPAYKYDLREYIHKEGYFWDTYTKLEKPPYIFMS